MLYNPTQTASILILKYFYFFQHFRSFLVENSNSSISGSLSLSHSLTSCKIDFKGSKGWKIYDNNDNVDDVDDDDDDDDNDIDDDNWYESYHEDDSDDDDNDDNNGINNENNDNIKPQ